MQQTDVRQHHRLMPPTIRGGGITKHYSEDKVSIKQSLTSTRHMLTHF